MNLAEAREFVAGMELMTGWSIDQAPTAEVDQALASLRDDLRELGVDTNDPQQMLCVFAGLMCAATALLGQLVSPGVIFRMTSVLRTVMDWKGDGGANLIPMPEPKRNRRWWRR